MTDRTVGVDVSGGQIQGIVGAGSVIIENLTFYGRAPEEPAQAAGAEPIGPCPYPGLAFFGPGDADLFFGRDAAIARLTEAVGRQSFTALMGASGSGKSSVVLAGLAPRLNNAGSWRFSHFRIGTELESKSAPEGSRPFRALARALVPFYVDSETDTDRLKNVNQLASALQQGELALSDVFSQSRSRNKGRRILLIADQFEEVFTTVADEAARTRFIDVLLAGFVDLAAGDAPDICLVLTMRADFYGRALRHRPLADALQNHVENLGPMNREELQQAIVRPAQNAGVTFEAGVVETLLDAVQSKPGGLPLLQFALREMWGRQERKKITRKSYDEIGGVEGALAQRAETVFAGLTRNGADPAMDKAFQRLFTRLVTLGEGQEDTRRVVERAELGDEVWGLAQRLAGEENRLVVTNASSARETAEVVHEALIRHWPKLVDWINRDRAFQSWLRQIASGIDLWSANPDDEGPLLRGGMLAQAAEWLARRGDDLSEKERAYIEASVALRQRLEAEKEAARQAEIRRQQELAEAAQKLADEQRERARTARRAVMWTQIAAAVFLVLTVAMTFLAVGLVGASSEAEERSQAANAAVRELARQNARAQGAIARIENDNDRYFEAAQAALAGLPSRLVAGEDQAEIAPLVELMRSAVDGFLAPPLRHQGRVLDAFFDPKGERVVTVSDDKAARIWDARTGAAIGRPLQHRKTIRAVLFDANGERVATASEDGTARIWDARSAEPIGKPLQHEAKGESFEGVNTVMFDSKSERVVTASDDGTARIWDARTGEPIGKPLRHSGRVKTATFDSTGERIVTASDDSLDDIIWDARTGEPIGTPVQHKRSVGSKGERVVVASDEGIASILNTRTGQPIGKPLVHKDRILTVVFDPTGERAVTATREGIHVWDARTGEPIGTLEQDEGEGRPVSFDPKGERIVTLPSTATTARIWHVSAGQPAARRLQHQDTIHTAVFDPKGERVVTASADGSARVWDGRTGTPIGGPLRHRGEVVTAVFDPKGERVVTASADGTARIWDVRASVRLRHGVTAMGYGFSGVNTAVFDSRGERVVTASDDSLGRIWDARTGEPIGKPLQHQKTVRTAAFDIKGERVVTASDDATARIWDARTGEPIGKPMQHNWEVKTAAFDAKGERIVTASGDLTARIWDARTGEPIGEPLPHEDSVAAAVFDSTGTYVLTIGQADKSARIWDVRTSALVGKPLQHRDKIRTAVFDPKGERVVTASDDGTARVWDARTGAPVGEPLPHQYGGLTSAVFDPAGERVVTTAHDQTARIWNARTGEPVGEPLKHENSVRAVAFDARGERIATASDDGTARIWDVRTGQPIGRSLQHQGNVVAVVFDPVGERVVTASEDGTARIWNVPPTGQILIDRVRATLGRNAPDPLKLPETAESGQGFFDAMQKGFRIVRMRVFGR